MILLHKKDKSKTLGDIVIFLRHNFDRRRRDCMHFIRALKYNI